MPDPAHPTHLTSDVDEVQDYIDNGGFPALRAPETVRIRTTAQHKVYAAIAAGLNNDADTRDVLLAQVLTIDEHCAGVLAAVETLAALLLVGVPRGGLREGVQIVPESSAPSGSAQQQLATWSTAVNTAAQLLTAEVSTGAGVTLPTYELLPHPDRVLMVLGVLVDAAVARERHNAEVTDRIWDAWIARQPHRPDDTDDEHGTNSP